MERLSYNIFGFVATAVILAVLTSLSFDTILLASIFAVLIYNGTLCLN